MSGDPSVEQYLSRHAEQIASEVPHFVSGVFDSALVVPAYNEEKEMLSRLLASAPSRGGRLLILVVNETELSPESAREKNAALIRAVSEVSSRSESRSDSKLSLHSAPCGRDGMAVLLVNSTGEASRLGPREGVGRARKMGMDAALSLYAVGKLISPFCGSSDADVHLPSDYFETLELPVPTRGSLPIVSGLLFPYRHLPDPSGELAPLMQEVELSFRYYVLGLASAGSPYAYHSLGSALAVSLPHYARARGVPNRTAGEDFHLLAKLSKLAPLRRVLRPMIHIETRLSDRVPFGTGPSLARASEERVAGRASVDYHPDSFGYLQSFLDALTQICSAEDYESRSLITHALSQTPAWVGRSAIELWEDLKPHLRACPSAAHRLRRLHEKFDALATLQFIHRAHREGLEKINLREALARVNWVPVDLGAAEALLRLQAREEGLPALSGAPSA